MKKVVMTIVATAGENSQIAMTKISDPAAPEIHPENHRLYVTQRYSIAAPAKTPTKTMTTKVTAKLLRKTVRNAGSGRFNVSMARTARKLAWRGPCD